MSEEDSNPREETKESLFQGHCCVNGFAMPIPASPILSTEEHRQQSINAHLLLLKKLQPKVC